MDLSIQSSNPWFKDPRVLMAGAIGAAVIAITGAAVGVASARTDATLQPSPSSGELSVVMQAPREPSQPAQTVGRMATLDPAALREQSQSQVSSDPEGDENLRIIDAQERRLQAMNDREAAAFAAQMRQTAAEDGLMEREVRTTDDTPDQTGYSTSNSIDTD